MRIHVRRTGGVAGIARTADLDVDSLPSDEADEFLELVASVGPGHGEAVAPDLAPDGFHYDVTVDEGAGSEPRVLRATTQVGMDEIQRLAKRVLERDRS